MKTKKIISFLLMLTVLFTMNIAPGFADDTVSPESTKLTLNFNSDGGNVVTPGTFTKNVLTCTTNEHNHEDGKCDLSVLNCTKLHTHDEGCYAVCPLDEHLGHDASCYQNQLTCGLDIHEHDFIDCTTITCGIEQHTHLPSCIGLVCTQEEHGALGLLGLYHPDSCYTLSCTKKISLSHWAHTSIGGCYTLTCGKELHIHDDILDDCYDKVCGKHTHVHIPSCHSYGKCGLQEHKEHTDACYSDVLICSGLHEHSLDCQPLTCTTPEHADKDHSIENGCYSCSLTEHTHNDEDECYDWPEAPVTATPAPGYYISSISIDGNPVVGFDTTGYSTSLKMDTNRVVDVVFALKPERELMVSFNKSASNPGSTNTWTITNPGTESIDYTWSINGSGTQSGTGTIAPDSKETLSTDVEGNPDTIEVSWTNSYGDTVGVSARATMYTYITADSLNGGFVDGAGTTLSGTPTYYFAGTTVTLTATPRSGYRFVNDSWDIVPNDDDVQVTTSGGTATLVISDGPPPTEGQMLMSTFDVPSWIEGIQVEGDFEVIPPVYNPTVYYTLNVAVEGPGSVSPASGTYTTGSLVVLSPVADEGARFIGWFGNNGSEVTDKNEISMTGSKSLIARFELIPPVEEELEEIIDEGTPESGDVAGSDEDEIVLDQEVPYDAGPILPQTGGIPMELIVGAGMALITAGISIKKKEKYNDVK